MRIATLLLLATGIAQATYAADKSRKPVANAEREVQIPVDSGGSFVRLKGSTTRGKASKPAKGYLAVAIVSSNKYGAVIDVAGTISITGATVDLDDSKERGFQGDNRSGVRVSADGAKIEFRGKTTRLNWINLALRPAGAADPTITVALATKKGSGVWSYKVTRDGLVQQVDATEKKKKNQ